MSTFSPENILLIGSIILTVGVILGKSIYRTGLPLLLVFLLIGMGFGCDGVGIQFDDRYRTGAASPNSWMRSRGARKS